MSHITEVSVPEADVEVAVQSTINTVWESLDKRPLDAIEAWLTYPYQTGEYLTEAADAFETLGAKSGTARAWLKAREGSQIGTLRVHGYDALPWTPVYRRVEVKPSNAFFHRPDTDNSGSSFPFAGTRVIATSDRAIVVQYADSRDVVLFWTKP